MSVGRDVTEGPVDVLVLDQRTREAAGAPAAEPQQRVVRRQHRSVVRNHLAIFMVRPKYETNTKNIFLLCQISFFMHPNQNNHNNIQNYPESPYQSTSFLAAGHTKGGP